MPHLRVHYLIAVSLLWSTASQAADLLVLRANAEVIRDRTVASMSFDGVNLDNGKVLGWDEIETGRLGGGRQELFDKYLKNVGVDLFRIRHRLSVGDYRSLTENAEAIAKYYQDRDSDTAYMVMQALMWGRLAQGRREEAVAPYWRCFEYLRTRQTADVKLPGDRRLKYDPATGMCDELAPVWFNTEAAKTALPEVAAAIGKLKQPRPVASRVYYATMALAAGKDEAAKAALTGISQAPERVSQLGEVIAVQREVSAVSVADNTARLAASVNTLHPANRPVAYYWLGRAQLMHESSRQKQQGVLKLLHLPAVFGETHPELAAAGLYEAMQALEKMEDLRGSIALRSELLSKYGQTYHATHLASNKE